MKWYGLTGGIASGKSEVASLLRKRGIPVIDADDLAHRVIEVGGLAHTKVVEEFGKNILDSSGQIDRAQLGKIVFADAEKLRKLESLVHPAVRRATEDEKARLQSKGTALAFYDVPLLFEKKMEGLFDSVILISAKEATRRQRMRDRNKWSDVEIQRRLDAQLPLSEKERQADVIIRNDGTLSDLNKAVEEFLKTINYQAQE